MSKFNDEDGRHFFEVYGPFDLDIEDGLIRKPTADWWRGIAEDYDPSPERGIGCYLFTLGDARIKPWYVGKTWCEGGFRDEAFTQHKLDHYNDAFAGRRGPARIFFFPLITRHFHDPDWQLSRDRTSTKRLINWLEKTLIGMALSQNADLMNARDTTFLRTVRLRSIIGKAPTGRRHGEVSLARKALLGE
jgi:hypothetical protein